MLTIGQLADHAGVTRRTVRHYHATGLLPEPARDQSGYRRYDARAVIDLIRIRTLAEAGVPLARISELLAAGSEEFAAALAEIDDRLRRQIRELREHRTRVAQLTSGDGLALPPEVVSYLARARELGLPERLVEVERDSWILIAAQAPEQVAAVMTLKRSQIEDPVVRDLFVSVVEIFDLEADDPALPAIADRVVAFVEALGASAEEFVRETPLDEDWLTPEIVELLDSTFIGSFAAGPRLLELLEERGYTGWTDMRPTGRED